MISLPPAVVSCIKRSMFMNEKEIVFRSKEGIHSSAHKSTDKYTHFTTPAPVVAKTLSPLDNREAHDFPLLTRGRSRLHVGKKLKQISNGIEDLRDTFSLQKRVREGERHLDGC